jgi:hypothetical protein
MSRGGILRNQRSSSIKYSDVSPRSKSSKCSPASAKESDTKALVDECKAMWADMVALGVSVRRIWAR